MIAARAALRPSRVAMMRAEEAGPPCAQCVFCGDEKPVPVCHHLVYLNPRFDPALGRYEGQSNRLTTAARSDDGYCGPEALLFESSDLLSKLRRAVTGDGAAKLYVGAGLVGLIAVSLF